MINRSKVVVLLFIVAPFVCLFFHINSVGSLLDKVLYFHS